MKILLYEHVSSGGYAGEPIPSSLLSEGYAMLRGIATDFKIAGQETTVLLDARIASCHPPLEADHLVQIGASGETETSIESAVDDCDAAYIVAPETNHLLQSLIECIESTGTLSLNCEGKAIEQASDKPSLENRVHGLGVQLPKTETFETSKDPKKVADIVGEKLSFPVVVKPAKGAGCGGISLVRRTQQLEAAFIKLQTEVPSDLISIQEFVRGIPVSVSLISNGQKAVPLSLNLQYLSLQGPGAASNYLGGQVPLNHRLRDAAFSAAKSLVESFEGLRGYVGVDLVLSSNEVVVLEVNPRLTTSYIGLRRTSSVNMADALLEAVTKDQLPAKPTHSRFCCFSKVALQKPTSPVFNRLHRLDYIAAPPYPLDEAESAFSMVACEGKTSQEASLKLLKAKKQLRQIALMETR